MPIENAVLHLISAAVIALTGVGVILWALLSRPRIRWDRFRIGLALLLLVAPVASIVAAAQLAKAIETANKPDGGFRRAYVTADTTVAVDLSVMEDASARADAAVALDSAGFSPR